MCTATLIRMGDSDLRLAFNRDESPLRTAASPPETRRFGARSAILPIDVKSDGSWIAVNDAGLVMAILNRDSTPPANYPASRGTIIPSLLHCDDLASANRLARDLATRPFAPFRLILADRYEVVEISVRDQESQMVHHRPDVPLLFTSSGLGDEFVRRPRQQLFDEWFEANDDRSARQDAFHRHSWPDQRDVSVCMVRERARTVSYTVIEIRSDSATMTYWPQPPDQSGRSFMARLTLASNLPLR